MAGQKRWAWDGDSWVYESPSGAWDDAFGVITEVPEGFRVVAFNPYRKFSMCASLEKAQAVLEKALGNDGGEAS
jgi:hypothetical protein